MSQLHTVLDELTQAGKYLMPDGYKHHGNVISMIEQMMQAEPVACLVETEHGVLVWPIDDFNDASTYCEPDEFPQYLYTHQAPQAVPAVPAVCEWTQDADFEMGDTYHSSCGELWSFIDGGPKENRVSYCHHCGKPVKLASAIKETPCK